MSRSSRDHGEDNVAMPEGLQQLDGPVQRMSSEALK